jgi:hypothetical protein
VPPHPSWRDLDSEPGNHPSLLLPCLKQENIKNKKTSKTRKHQKQENTKKEEKNKKTPKNNKNPFLAAKR